jgi:hypothetical protein
MPAPHAIHRYAAGPAGAFVNAYLVEGETGVVAVDGTLTVSDGRALRGASRSSPSRCWAC